MTRNVGDGFDEMWGRIEAHAGEVFTQKRGGEFRYRMIGNMVVPDRTNHQLPRSHFRTAYERMPVDGPGALGDLRGPSYLYAILTDPRIRGE